MFQQTVLSMSRSGLTSIDKLLVSGLAGLVYAGEVQVHEIAHSFRVLRGAILQIDRGLFDLPGPGRVRMQAGESDIAFPVFTC